VGLRKIIVCGGLVLGFANVALAQVPPTGVSDLAGQEALLKSDNPKEAANKKLVFDMYRIFVNGGHTEEAAKYFTESYIQHNPNVITGRDAFVAYVKQTRPAVAIPKTVGFPIISIMAEGDMVMIATVSYAPDPTKPGTKYASTHFDLYRIENGKIAEHWDHVPKDPSKAHFNPNTETKK
jgi:predicted SnoaL-like aldol condensation-catalyzing enzyme